MAQAQTKKNSGGLGAGIVVLIAVIICNVIFYTVFKGQVQEKGEQNVLGLMYKGGFVVPFLMAIFVTCITFAIERLLTIAKAAGTGSLETFLQSIKSKLSSNDINSALAECNKQKGAVANVVQAGLHKYAEMEKNTELEGEQKILNIQKEVEEATALELPALEKNMWILATISSVGTLIALLGTVIGMIKAFKGLSGAGGSDPEKLAEGISEALINTALGIFTSALAIIFYNLCTQKIDKLTYAIDELGYTIAQTFAGRKH
ncbi:MAG TPA: MotA/TolQ/ExbB proton channel family protein [Chitinophagales bacterium]|jgi:biopolymer transport protein ExbB|nr:MotA/TolQ/ExbB proton channel family protein [Chitinophagales bacterium]HOY40882.1 MotA/TolQ/ExbB proton channel family protein [Chitinophagales bacterium]HPH88254.1 MotA/TolQ/ExbB proton channel family protein [Chitinophagales bacterium]HPN19259.1 MotA/TolQ/ExbB proton channel family protein [Chitinophagales bacterium]